jgi:hypothetical protein
MRLEFPAVSLGAFCGDDYARESAAPINLVEKPIHDHEQDDNGEQPRRGLQIRAERFPQLADEPRRDT